LVTFKIVCFNLLAGGSEVIGITGNIKELGNWKKSSAIVLNRSEGNLFSIKLNIPTGTEVKYRYLKGNVQHETFTISTWEAANEPRSFMVPDDEKFLKHDGLYGETVICKPSALAQNSELRLTFSCCKERPFIKIGGNGSSCCPSSKISKMNVSAKSCFSSKLLELTPMNSKTTSECADLMIEIPQSTSNVFTFVFEYQKEDFLAATIVLMNKDGKSLGTTQIFTSTLENLRGNICLPVVDSVQRTIAQINVQYLIVHPFNADGSFEYSMNVWNRTSMLLVGHRGCGNSFTSKKLSALRENSLKSFQKVSETPGAFMEFDVHLTKDFVPIVYHDLTVCLETVKVDGSPALTEVPVCELTLDEVQNLKLKHRSRKTSSRELCFDENDFKENPPFPSLAQVFDEVPIETGFNMELKYPGLDVNGKFEDNLKDYIDANLFVDSILEIVFQKCGDREIVFSSFNVDICIA